MQQGSAQVKSVIPLSPQKVAEIFRSDEHSHKPNPSNISQNQSQSGTHPIMYTGHLGPSQLQKSSLQHNSPFSQVQQAISRLNYNQQTKQDFSTLYHNSLFFSNKKQSVQNPIPDYLLNFIGNFKAFRQDKIYNLALGDSHSFFEDYLHLKSLNPNPTAPTQNLSQSSFKHEINFAQMNINISQVCADKVFDKVSKQILAGQFSNIFYRKNNLIQAKQQLETNISNLRKSLIKDSQILPNRQVVAYQNGEQAKKKRDQMLFMYLASRKKSTWEDQRKSKQISQFLNKVKLQRSMTHDRYKKSLEKTQLNQKKYWQAMQKNKWLQIKKNVDKELQKHHQFKSQFSQSEKLNKQKSKQIAEYLSKYQSQKPIYERLDQQFRNKQKQWNETDRKILDQIHEERKVILLSELQNHSKITSERIKHKKQIMAESVNKIKHQEQQILEKLNSLFHGKFHKNISDEKNEVIIDQKQLKKEKLRKSLSYSVQVVSKKHKPSIDPLKQMQMKSLIEQQIRSHQNLPKTIKIKRKILKSSQFIEPESQKIEVNVVQVQTNQKDGDLKPKEMEDQEIEIEADPSKIGKQYLKQLRILNEGKPRKKVEEKKEKIPQKKIFDFSKQKKDHFKINLTLSEWKKVLERQTDHEKGSPKNMPIREKEQLLAPYIKRIQADSDFYEGEKRKINHYNTRQVLSLNKKLGKCYIENIRSKLEILKD